MQDNSVIERLVTYMAWADDVMLKNAESLSSAAVKAKHDTLFDTIAGTFDHILIVSEIFKAHLKGQLHSHQARRRTQELPFCEIADRLRAMDAYFVELVQSLTSDGLKQAVSFKFIDGNDGVMTREDMLLHLVNHATYHRGFISTLMFPLQPNIEASDFTVFMRDACPQKIDLRR